MAPAASASVGYQSNAVGDGIGYRSNLMDPLNPYATSRESLFSKLLEKYEASSDHEERSQNQDIYSRNMTGDKYISEVQGFFSSKKVKLKAKKYSYGWGVCETNIYPSALYFMKAAVKELGRSDETDRLIIVRHHLLKLCNIKKAGLGAMLLAVLKPLREKKSHAPWAMYLDGAISFYEKKFEEAKAKFASINEEESNWVKDTADYMDVRISKARIDTLYWPYSGSSNFSLNPKRYLETKKPKLVLKLDRALSNLRKSMKKYLRDHPKGRYVATVQDLIFYIHWSNGDRNALIEATHRVFAKAMSLQKGDYPSDAIFEFPKDVKNISVIHPLAVVGILLSELTSDLRSEEITSSVLRGHFKSHNELSASFPGLASYFELLLLALDAKFQELSDYEISRKAFGPLYAEALILQARAHGKVNRHMEAANLWKRISEEFPLYNGLTEVATSYVRAGKFIDFTKINKSWMTELTLEEPNQLKEIGNEFEVDVKTFYAKRQPYRNILQRGFATITSNQEAKTVYKDVSLHPLIRFLAAEPTLRENLLKENYSAFVETTEHLFDADFEKEFAKSKTKKGTELISEYRGVLPKVKTLIRNPKDANALTNIGYFIYAQHLHPKCLGEETLWETTLQVCNKERLKETSSDFVRPIDLFLKALSIYKTQPIRASEEAKVLRILIYCFKGYENQNNCTRGSEDKFPESLRKGFFQRLHKYFPEKAKATPHWY